MTTSHISLKSLLHINWNSRKHKRDLSLLFKMLLFYGSWNLGSLYIWVFGSTILSSCIVRLGLYNYILVSYCYWTLCSSGFTTETLHEYNSTCVCLLRMHRETCNKWALLCEGNLFWYALLWEMCLSIISDWMHAKVKIIHYCSEVSK